MIRVGLPMLPGIELTPVSLNKRQQNEEALFQKHSRRAHVSPMFLSSYAGNIASSVCSCFQDTNYAYATQQGILTEV